MTDRNTIVFGLDGACFDLVEPWMESGSLPTLASLAAEGTRAPLESCRPATTPPAWTSLTTGVNPGKHGIFGFYRRQPDDYELSPVSDSDVSARRLWDYTTDGGLTALVLNVPITHPPRDLDGALVPGYLAGDAPETSPGDLLSSLGLEDYRVYAASEGADPDSDRLFDEWLALTEDRQDLALRAMDAYDWDLLFLEFQKTDGAVHKFDEKSKVRQIYERVDACMATILDSVEEEPNVFVVSDHGIGQPKEWSVALNTWLVETGYATTTTATPSNRDWTAGAMQGDGIETESPPGGEGLATRMLQGLGRLGVTKQRLERALSTLGLYELATRLAPPGAGSGLEQEIVHEANSRVFYQGMGFSGVDVGVTINAAEYYDEGVVADDEYEALRSTVIDDLRGLTGPDGARAFTSVQPREDVFHGERTPDAPDVVLEQSADYVIGSSQPRGQTFIPTDAGRVDHTRTGLLIAAGPDIDPSWTPPRTPSIVDVTPTLVHLFALPLNERFDGDPWTGLLATDRTPRSERYDPYVPPTGEDRSTAERERVEDRLRGLGYLE